MIISFVLFVYLLISVYIYINLSWALGTGSDRSLKTKLIHLSFLLAWPLWGLGLVGVLKF